MKDIPTSIHIALRGSLILCLFVLCNVDLSAQYQPHPPRLTLSDTSSTWDIDLYKIHLSLLPSIDTSTPDQSNIHKTMTSRGVILSHELIQRAFFCRMEERATKSGSLNLRMRLGSLDYVNTLEGKPHYRRPQR